MSLHWKRMRGWVAAAGVAVVASGLLRYLISKEFTRLNIGLLIAGGILFLASVAMSYREFIAFFGHRSSKLGTNTLTLSVLVVAILGLANFFSSRHSARIDLTTEKLYTLSDQTRGVLTELKQDVEMVHFARQADVSLGDLAEAYQRISPRVRFREVDPQLRPEVARQYNVTELNRTVVSSGAQTVTIENSSEQELTNAILKVTRSNTKTICFLEGHGEKSTTATDATGYANMVRILTSEGYTIKPINIVSAGEVPSECTELVVAGPRQALLAQETQLINKYLDNNGNALLLLDPEVEVGLENVYEKWNITLGKNIVVDASGAGRMFGAGPAVPLVIQYGESPITRNFNGTMTFFPLARTASIVEKPDPQIQNVELLKTSSRTFTVPNLKTREVSYDPATGQAGPLNLGVSAERKSESEGTTKSAKLVVIGNSMFATNQWAELQRNGDLFLNAVHWLSEDEDLISIRPKSPTNRRVLITETQQKELYWLSMIVLPGIVLVSGIFLWWRRR